MPEVRFVTVEPLRAAVKCELIIKIINPTPHQTTISFSQINLEEHKQEDVSFEEPAEVAEKKVKQKLLNLYKWMKGVVDYTLFVWGQMAPKL